MRDEDFITNWHGKPIGDLTRGELVDALDWCCKELRKHNEEYHHRTKVPVVPRGVDDKTPGRGYYEEDVPGYDEAS